MAGAEPIFDPRIVAALEEALASSDAARLVDRLERASGLPGRPNLRLAAAVGDRLAAAGAPGRELALALAEVGTTEKRPTALFLAYVGLSGLGAAAARGGASAALEAVHDAAGDTRHEIREAAQLSLGIYLERAGDAGLRPLERFFDGFLHAHTALAALTTRPVLDRLKAGAPLLALLDRAFLLADAATRSADRSQGVRTLRKGLPAQIAAITVRFEDESATWLEGWLDRAARPESREVLAEALAALRRRSLSEPAVERLRARLDASAPPDRDAARVVHGTRKRSRGRR